MTATFFFFGHAVQHVWDLGSPAWGETASPAVEAWSLNHWTAREVQTAAYLKQIFFPGF